jgi:cellobiose epimerase
MTNHDRSLYRDEVTSELRSILQYWMNTTQDEQQGGFFGRIDGEGRIYPDAPKGLVLNSRILWTFSAACRATGDPLYLPVARRAFDFLLRHFLDKENGGAWWSLSADGHPLDDRKQIYGLAFCLYGLSEFYLATGHGLALEQAIAQFRVIDQYSYDKKRMGYDEAFSRDWQSLTDLRLSDKDANLPRTMNTHLHLLEAYANLYRCWPDDLLRQRIRDLLDIFDRFIVDRPTGHLMLFFDENWKTRSGIVSYGHDIEAAWLLPDAAKVISDDLRIATARSLAMRLSEAAAEGLDSDGGLWYEKENDHLVREKHWWPQAEAMVGFLNAWQISGAPVWWQRSRDSWEFVKHAIRDIEGGEWFWGVQADHSPMPGQDKAGFWKCPYHNSRACLEIMRRLVNA